MVRYLLDTNTLSEVIKPLANSNVIEKYLQCDYEIATASIVVFEMLNWAYGNKSIARQSEIMNFIENVVLKLKIYDYDANAAHWHSKEYYRLVSQGKTPSKLDGQIAAIAKVNELILVTRNIKDVVNYQDLTIENWFEK
jgi:tRNA(fMet)-specific endonuclease VapC